MFYLHIPKTGGQTLARRLASAFPPGRSHLQADQFTYPADCERFEVCLSGHDFVEAHVTGELLAGRAPDDLLVTVREPVAQIISNFRHIRREPERRLSRAARELDPGTFFDHFGDFFADFQTRYLLSAFLPLALEEERCGFWPLAAQRLPQVLARVRWLVPTDRIDAFLPLWEAETGRQAAERSYATNHAPDDGVDLAALEAAIRARPALFALDNVLYQYAQTRFAAWADGVRQSLVPWDYPANAARVFHAGGGGVWLRRGWYPSEETSHGAGNWAGPRRRSDLTIRRGAGQDSLAFDVTVINGITPEGITAHNAASLAHLPLACEEIEPDHWRYRIDLSALPEACEVALMVPDCYAAINVFAAGEDAGLERRSFLATGWQLAPAENAKTRHSAAPAAACTGFAPAETTAAASPAEVEPGGG